MIPVDKIVILKHRETKWRTLSSGKISEVISYFVSVQSSSVALEGSCQSMVYRSVAQLINKIHAFMLVFVIYCSYHKACTS